VRLSHDFTVTIGQFTGHDWPVNFFAQDNGEARISVLQLQTPGSSKIENRNAKNSFKLFR